MEATRIKKKFSGDYIGYFRKKPFIIAIAVILCAALYFGLPLLFRTTYRSSLPASAASSPETLKTSEPALAEPTAVTHLPAPKPQKFVYMTSCVVGTLDFRADLVKLVEETELNGIVIDIKDYTGTLSFIPKSETLKAFVSTTCVAPDMQEFVKALHEKNIYVIGRITVFQDPTLARRRPELAVKKASDGSAWKDFKGISYTDPGSREVWEHAALIAEEAYNIGFDELNFDYIRFPSDGPMTDIAYPWSGNRAKSDVMEEFFEYLSERLRPLGAVISADVFGMTTTNTDDLNIGQVLEKVVPYFDYVSPMVYPSHFPPRFNGWDNPNARPYDIVKFSMDSAIKRFLATTTVVALAGTNPLASTTPPLYPKKAWHIEKLRPWLQDFDYGGNYDIAEVRAQITAVYDAGLTSWMLWAPSNIYTRDALLPE
jgi:hypothetical protein